MASSSVRSGCVGRYMETKLAVIACTAAVLDDVMSLILLSEISSLQSNETLTSWQYAAPAVGCVVCVVVGLALVQVTESRVRCVPPSHHSPCVCLWVPQPISWR